jgi:hypothetical protein
MTEYKSWDELTLAEQLQETWSDFHKAVHGFRPRFATTEQWESAEWLQEQIDGLGAYLDSFKSTREGRNQLRDEGWVVNAPVTAEQDGWVDHQALAYAELDARIAREIAAEEAEAALQYPGKDYEHLEVV